MTRRKGYILKRDDGNLDVETFRKTRRECWAAARKLYETTNRVMIAHGYTVVARHLDALLPDPEPAKENA